MPVRSLTVGAATAAALIAIPVVAATATSPSGHATRDASATSSVATARHKLPVAKIEKIVGLDGSVSSGVLDLSVSRPAIHDKGPHGVRFVTGFGVMGDIDLQQRGAQAVLNADIPVLPKQIQRTIDAIQAHHLVLQAEHQHLYNMHPMVWFLHFRGKGNALALAADVHAVLTAARVALPQSEPKHPTTPLPAKTLAKVLGGEATVGEHGVVTVDIPRTSGVTLAGTKVSPDLNIASNVQFEPLAGGRAAVLPDFAMTSGQVQRVIRMMRADGWEIGCLYNQETAEHPQLYFSHTFKTGDPVALAEQVRRALNETDASNK